MTDETDNAGEQQLGPAPEGMRCHDCDRIHRDWSKIGEHAVEGPHHCGIIERWEYGYCGSTIEGGRP